MGPSGLPTLWIHCSVCWTPVVLPSCTEAGALLDPLEGSFCNVHRSLGSYRPWRRIFLASVISWLLLLFPRTDLATRENGSSGVCRQCPCLGLDQLTSRLFLISLYGSVLMCISPSLLMFVFLNKQNAVFSKPIKITSSNTTSCSHGFSAVITQLVLHPTNVTLHAPISLTLQSS